jgi:hypothetical protein
VRTRATRPNALLLIFGRILRAALIRARHASDALCESQSLSQVKDLEGILDTHSERSYLTARTNLPSLVSHVSRENCVCCVFMGVSSLRWLYCCRNKRVIEFLKCRFLWVYSVLQDATFTAIAQGLQQDALSLLNKRVLEFLKCRFLWMVHCTQYD